MNDINNLVQKRHMSVKKLVNFIFGLVAGCCVGVLSYVLLVVLFEPAITDSREEKIRLGDDNSRVFSAIEDVIRTVAQDPSSSSRTQHLLSRIGELDREEMIKLIDLSIGTRRSSILAEVQDLMMAELARGHPEDALSKIWDFPFSRWTEMIEIVFSEWGHADLEQALQAVAELRGVFLDTAIQTILTERDDVSDHAIIDIAKSRQIEFNFKTYFTNNMILNMLDQPSTAWNMAMQEGVGDVGQSVLLVDVVKAWFLEDGWEVLNYLYESLYQNNARLFDELLNSIVTEDPKSAFEFALNSPQVRREIFLPRLLKIWADTDPQQAFHSTFQIDRLSSREIAQNTVANIWARQDPSGFLEHIGVLPRELFRQSLPVAIRKLSQSAPRIAAERVQELKEQFGNVSIDTEFALVEEWASVDATSVVEWVNNNVEENSQKHARMMQRIVSRYALVNAEEAMLIALSEAPHEFHDGIGLETFVISSLIRSGEVEHALSLLDQVRESARLSSFTSIGRALLNSDGVDALVALARQLPEKDQSNYFYALSHDWLRRDPQGLVDTIATFPSSAVRAEVAQYIMKNHASLLNTLTKEHLDLLDSIEASTFDKPL